jgi:hypothetical protein
MVSSVLIYIWPEKEKRRDAGVLERFVAQIRRSWEGSLGWNPAKYARKETEAVHGEGEVRRGGKTRSKTASRPAREA